jgi:general secretion pathway protein G
VGKKPRRNITQDITSLLILGALIYGGINYGPGIYYHLRQDSVAATKADMSKLGEALEAYRIDMGEYPRTSDGLAALTTSPNRGPNWHGPYLRQSISHDAWGNSYVYRSPGVSGQFDLISYGHDGEPGGQGEDADISYFH